MVEQTAVGTALLRADRKVEVSAQYLAVTKVARKVVKMVVQ